jgi:hypothetical protein
MGQRRFGLGRRGWGIGAAVLVGMGALAACTPIPGPGSISCSAQVEIAVPTSHFAAQSDIPAGTVARAVLYKNGTKIAQVDLTMTATGSLSLDVPTPIISSQPRHWRGEVLVNDVVVCFAEADTGTPAP